MNRNIMEFRLDNLAPLADDRMFASMAEKYSGETPIGISFLGFLFHATAPLINRKGMSITLPTMQASYQTAQDKMVDFEHMAEDLPLDVDRTIVVGHIKELEMANAPAEDDGEAWIIPGIIPRAPLVTKGVMVLYDRIASVRDIVDDVRAGTPWYFSLEIGEQHSEPEIWLLGDDATEHELIPWNNASDDLKDVASKAEEVTYKGRKLAYLMGGSRGKLSFIGGAVTASPAGREQFSPGQSLKFIASSNPDTRRRIFAVDWAPGDGIEMPDSTFAVVHQGKGYLPYRGPDGKPNIGMLAKAMSSLKDLKAPDNTITDQEMQEQAYKVLAPYARLVRDIKAGEAGELEPEMRTMSYLVSLSRDIDGIIEAADLYAGSQGGERQVAEVEMTQAEFDKAINDATESGKKAAVESALTAAVEAGTHIPADDVQERVDAEVDLRVRRSKRQAAVDELPVNDAMRADLALLAMNSELHPFDDAGDLEFGKAIERWKASLAGDKAPGDDANREKETASMGETGKSFDPGSGDGGAGADDNKPTLVTRYYG